MKQDELLPSSSSSPEGASDPFPSALRVSSSSPLYLNEREASMLAFSLSEPGSRPLLGPGPSIAAMPTAATAAVATMEPARDAGFLPNTNRGPSSAVGDPAAQQAPSLTIPESAAVLPAANTTSSAASGLGSLEREFESIFGTEVNQKLSALKGKLLKGKQKLLEFADAVSSADADADAHRHSQDGDEVDDEDLASDQEDNEDQDGEEEQEVDGTASLVTPSARTGNVSPAGEILGEHEALPSSAPSSSSSASSSSLTSGGPGGSGKPSLHPQSHVQSQQQHRHHRHPRGHKHSGSGSTHYSSGRSSSVSSAKSSKSSASLTAKEMASAMDLLNQLEEALELSITISNSLNNSAAVGVGVAAPLSSAVFAGPISPIQPLKPNRANGETTEMTMTQDGKDDQAAQGKEAAGDVKAALKSAASFSAMGEAAGPSSAMRSPPSSAVPKWRLEAEAKGFSFRHLPPPSPQRDEQEKALAKKTVTVSTAVAAGADGPAATTAATTVTQQLQGSPTAAKEESGSSVVQRRLDGAFAGEGLDLDKEPRRSAPASPSRSREGEVAAPAAPEAVAGAEEHLALAAKLESLMKQLSFSIGGVVGNVLLPRSPGRGASAASSADGDVGKDEKREKREHAVAGPEQAQGSKPALPAAPQEEAEAEAVLQLELALLTETLAAEIAADKKEAAGKQDQASGMVGVGGSRPFAMSEASRLAAVGAAKALSSSSSSSSSSSCEAEVESLNSEQIRRLADEYEAGAAEGGVALDREDQEQEQELQGKEEFLGADRSAPFQSGQQEAAAAAIEVATRPRAASFGRAAVVSALRAHGHLAASQEEAAPATTASRRVSLGSASIPGDRRWIVPFESEAGSYPFTPYGQHGEAARGDHQGYYYYDDGDDAAAYDYAPAAFAHHPRGTPQPLTTRSSSWRQNNDAAGNSSKSAKRAAGRIDWASSLRRGSSASGASTASSFPSSSSSALGMSLFLSAAARNRAKAASDALRVANESVRRIASAKRRDQSVLDEPNLSPPSVVSGYTSVSQQWRHQSRARSADRGGRFDVDNGARRAQSAPRLRISSSSAGLEARPAWNRSTNTATLSARAKQARMQASEMRRRMQLMESDELQPYYHPQHPLHPQHHQDQEQLFDYVEAGRRPSEYSSVSAPFYRNQSQEVRGDYPSAPVFVQQPQLHPLPHPEQHSQHTFAGDRQRPALPYPYPHLHQPHLPLPLAPFPAFPQQTPRPVAFEGPEESGFDGPGEEEAYRPAEWEEEARDASVSPLPMRRLSPEAAAPKRAPQPAPNQPPASWRWDDRLQKLVPVPSSAAATVGRPLPTARGPAAGAASGSLSMQEFLMQHQRMMM